MNTGNDVLSSYLVLNFDFIYYLFYLFLKYIVNFILNPFGFFGSTTNVGVLDKLANNSSNLYTHYSLFIPPQGGFGGLDGWLQIFYTNPINPNLPSFFDLFFRGVNTIIYFSIVLLLIIIYILDIKRNQLEKEEESIYDTVYSEEIEKTEGVQKASRWEKINKNIVSDNESDWKIAIIDADSLLEETLRDFGITGESLADILKNSDFDTLKNAWAAHKIRNQIAHNYSYKLTKQEAKRAIANYSKVFSEFYHI